MIRWSYRYFARMKMRVIFYVEEKPKKRKPTDICLLACRIKTTKKTSQRDVSMPPKNGGSQFDDSTCRLDANPITASVQRTMPAKYIINHFSLVK